MRCVVSTLAAESQAAAACLNRRGSCATWLRSSLEGAVTLHLKSRPRWEHSFEGKGSWREPSLASHPNPCVCFTSSGCRIVLRLRTVVFSDRQPLDPLRKDLNWGKRLLSLRPVRRAEGCVSH